MIVIFSWFCSPQGDINSSCGNYGFFLTWGEPFQGCGEAYGLCPRSRAWRGCVPRLPRFIPMGSFSGTLLAVSILDIVYDYHL